MYPEPLTDLVLWLRVLGGVALGLGVPGFLVLGRLLPLSWPEKAAWSLGTGILLASGAAILTSNLHAPFHPWLFLGLTVVLGAGFSFVPYIRDMAVLLAGKGCGFTRWQWLGVGVICLTVAGTVIATQGDYPVPPAPHDGGNHAFLALRIVETGYTDSEHLFADPWAQPQRPYFVGWHAAAALVSVMGRVPPYLATWMLSLLSLILLPFSLVTVWRLLRVPAAATVLAAALLPVCGNILVEIPWRSGLGQFVGMFCLFVPMTALVRSIRRGHVGLAIVAGLTLGSLVWVHGSWTMVAILLATVALWQRRSLVPAAAGRSWLAVLVALLTLLLVVIWNLLPTAGVYQENAFRPQELISLSDALLELSRSAGTWAPLQVVVMIGLVVGLLRTRTRALALLSVAIGALAVNLAAYQDPISMTLSQPWYQIYFRLMRIQVFLLPPLLAMLVWRPLLVSPGFWQGKVRLLAVGGTVAVLILPAFWFLDAAKLQTKVLFTADDVALAARIPEVVPEGKLIANWRNDGSGWAMHIGDRKFLMGTNWILGETVNRDYRTHVKELVMGLLTPRVQMIRQMGTDYIWATDHWMFPKARPLLVRERMDRAPHFTSVLRGQHSSLYRVNWAVFENAARQ